MAPPPFTKLRGPQQLVYQPIAGIRMGIIDITCHLVGRRWQTDQLEIEATSQRPPRCGHPWFQLRRLQTDLHKTVDRTARPGGRCAGRHHALQRAKSPVRPTRHRVGGIHHSRFVGDGNRCGRSDPHPVFKSSNLSFGERFVRRHT